MFKRRVGKSMHDIMGPNNTSSANGCPDILELANGDFAVIGVRKTNLLKANLPQDAGCGPDEEIVVIPRSLLVNAKSDIPEL